ncbi:uncharacterized protein LOC141928117 isoform X1 [Strix aluco]|uniref:uncharacterized protein LOC141928117 isoform X1 n=1 Tax=Strix aluco TaxID=111821 RepID=UPI003DA40242
MWLAFGAVHLQAGEAAEELAEAQADVVRRGVGIARKGTEEGDAVARRAPGSPLHGTTLKRGTVAQTEKLREKRAFVLKMSPGSLGGRGDRALLSSTIIGTLSKLTQQIQPPHLMHHLPEQISAFDRQIGKIYVFLALLSMHGLGAAVHAGCPPPGPGTPPRLLAHAGLCCGLRGVMRVSPACPQPGWDCNPPCKVLPRSMLGNLGLLRWVADGFVGRGEGA